MWCRSSLARPAMGMSRCSWSWMTSRATSELLYGFPPAVIGLKPTDPLFHLLEQIQNEVHRFAITFHKEKRSKGTFRTQLTDIPGIGEKTARDLLLKFGSLKEVRLQTEADLAKVVGPAKAKIIIDYFAQ